MRTSFSEFMSATKSLREIAFLGALDVKQRYRRSTLGPFWITIATGLNVAGLTLVFGAVFQSPFAEYVPFLACGLILWSYLSMSLTEAAELLVSQREAILERSVSLFELAGRFIIRNIYIAAHSFVIVIIVLLVFQKFNLFGFFVALLGLFIVTLFIYFSSICIALVGARYRDLSPILVSLLQMLFYLTPIVWAPDVMIERGRSVVVVFNPFYHLIEVVRAPLLGGAASISSVVVAILMTLLSALVAFWLVKTYKKRISYWV